MAPEELCARFVGEIQGTVKRRLEGLSKMVQENARKLVFEIHVDTLKASKGWFFRFLTWNRLALRKKKNSKRNMHKENELKQLHQKLFYTN